jgi:hypothetical protein
MEANTQHDPAENPEAKIILGKGAKQPGETELRVKYPALYDVKSHKDLIFERLESFKRNIFFKIPTDFRNDEKLFAGINQKIDGVFGRIKDRLNGAHLTLQTSCEPLSPDEDEIERNFRIRTSLMPLNVVFAIGNEMSELQEMIDYVHRISEINQKRKKKEQDKKESENGFNLRGAQALDSFNKAMDIIGGEKLSDTSLLGANLSRRLTQIRGSQKIKQSPEQILPSLEDYSDDLGRFRKDQNKLSGLIKALTLEEDKFKKYFSDGAQGKIPQIGEDLFLDYDPDKNNIPGEIEKVISAGQTEVITVVGLDAQLRENARIERERLAKETAEKEKIAAIARKKMITLSTRLGIPLAIGITAVSAFYVNKHLKEEEMEKNTITLVDSASGQNYTWVALNDGDSSGRKPVLSRAQIQKIKEVHKSNPELLTAKIKVIRWFEEAYSDISNGKKQSFDILKTLTIKELSEVATKDMPLFVTSASNMSESELFDEKQHKFDAMINKDLVRLFKSIYPELDDLKIFANTPKNSLNTDSATLPLPAFCNRKMAIGVRADDASIERYISQEERDRICRERTQEIVDVINQKLNEPPFFSDIALKMPKGFPDLVGMEASDRLKRGVRVAYGDDAVIRLIETVKKPDGGSVANIKENQEIGQSVAIRKDALCAEKEEDVPSIAFIVEWTDKVTGKKKSDSTGAHKPLELRSEYCTDIKSK